MKRSIRFGLPFALVLAFAVGFLLMGAILPDVLGSARDAVEVPLRTHAQNAAIPTPHADGSPVEPQRLERFGRPGAFIAHARPSRFRTAALAEFAKLQARSGDVAGALELARQGDDAASQSTVARVVYAIWAESDALAAWDHAIANGLLLPRDFSVLVGPTLAVPGRSRGAVDRIARLIRENPARDYMPVLRKFAQATYAGGDDTPLYLFFEDFARLEGEKRTMVMMDSVLSLAKHYDLPSLAGFVDSLQLESKLEGRLLGWVASEIEEDMGDMSAFRDLVLAKSGIAYDRTRSSLAPKIAASDWDGALALLDAREGHGMALFSGTHFSIVALGDDQMVRGLDVLSLVDDNRILRAVAKRMLERDRAHGNLTVEAIESNSRLSPDQKAVILELRAAPEATRGDERP